jgi:hypothetical protein
MNPSTLPPNFGARLVKGRRALTLLALICAGEAVFFYRSWLPGYFARRFSKCLVLTTWSWARRMACMASLLWWHILLAAVTGSIMVAVFAALLPTDASDASLEQKTTALDQVILLLLSITAGTAALLWFLLPGSDKTQASQSEHKRTPRLHLGGIAHVMAMPAVWLQVCIILDSAVGRSIPSQSVDITGNVQPCVLTHWVIGYALHGFSMIFRYTPTRCSAWMK